jgi:hypothetical protein
MSILRQRPFPLEKSTEPGRVREPQQYRAPKTTSRQLFLIFLIPLAIPVFFLWSPLQRHLSPTSYALCSRDGRRIYTADPVNTIVQCAVIHNSKFVDVGPLCESPNTVLRLSFNPHTPTLAEVQARWPSISSNQGTKLKIRYLEENFIVVPGISGSIADLEKI